MATERGKVSKDFKISSRLKPESSGLSYLICKGGYQNGAISAYYQVPIFFV